MTMTTAPADASPSTQTARWEARRKADSSAQCPVIEAAGDVVRYVAPQYDDGAIVAWVRDAVLADEVRALIALRPTMLLYPLVRVRR